MGFIVVILFLQNDPSYMFDRVLNTPVLQVSGFVLQLFNKLLRYILFLEKVFQLSRATISKVSCFVAFC